MKQGWKKYLLYASIVIAGGAMVFILLATTMLKNTGFEGKSLWDWMELLIIPFALAGGAFYLNRSERKVERELATDSQQEAALQVYVNRMAELMVEKKLRTSRNKEVRNVARLLTLDVLRRLDGKRKGIVLKYLYDAGLISKHKTIVNLRGADLSGADLVLADLINVNLNGARFWEADLTEADLSGADLRNADFDSADLRNAKFRGANLSSAYLSWAFLLGADLSNANLRRAFIYSTVPVPGNIDTAKSLKGATMPDGTKHD